jgi:hypothetical protein
VGWSNDKGKAWEATRRFTPEWNALAEEWFKLIDTEQILVTVWDVAEMTLCSNEGWWR